MTAKATTQAPNPRIRVRSKYDAAETTYNNRRHWAMTDALSANATNSPEVRAVIRSRARYEVGNNSWAKGMSLTLAKSVIGKGPRLQINTKNRELNRKAEAVWMKWSKRIRLAAKLRTARMARVDTGEAFGLIGINPGLDIPTNVDFRLVEADQVASPERSLTFSPNSDCDIVDGIEFDAYGNPTAYYVLPCHPGSDLSSINITPRRILARQMVHWQREDRPGVHRAVPEITPALGLFAQLRRYTLAVVDAAEVAAEHTSIIHTTSLPQDTAPAEVPEASDFGEIELSRRMATFLPDGWNMSQMKAEQPVTVYDAFVMAIINEIARCLEIPLNIASGNSGGYNFASGRLDGRIFDKFVDVERDDCEGVVIDRLFDVWIRQLTLLSEFTEWRGREAELAHEYFWDGNEAVDPAKEANAQETQLRSDTTTEARECARRGDDWETQQEQRTREKLNKIRLAKVMASDYGLTEDEAVAVVTTATPAPAPLPPDKDEDK